MENIQEFRIIADTNIINFQELLKEVIKEYQDKKYKVEIQFQANNNQLVTLVIGRK